MLSKRILAVCAALLAAVGLIAKEAEPLHVIPYPQSVEMLASIKEDGLEGTIVKYTGIGASDPLVGEIAAAFKKVETL